VSELSLISVVVAASTNDQNNSDRDYSFHILSIFIFDKFCANTVLNNHTADAEEN
jgi:hypothetical protein